MYKLCTIIGKAEPFVRMLGMWLGGPIEPGLPEKKKVKGTH
jgi:hypothetical protein